MIWIIISYIAGFISPFVIFLGYLKYLEISDYYWDKKFKKASIIYEAEYDAMTPEERAEYYDKYLTCWPDVDVWNESNDKRHKYVLHRWYSSNES